MDDLEMEAGRQLLEERNRLREAMIDILRTTRFVALPEDKLAYIEKTAEKALEP